MATRTQISLTEQVQGTLPVGNGGTGVGSLSSTPAASSIAEWDANVNMNANAFVPGTTSVTTGGTTTTLSITSTQIQVFTGSTTQTVKLPTTSVAAGAEYIVINQSSGAVTVQSSGANTIATQAGSTVGTYIAQKATPTGAADWVAVISANGKVLTTNNTLTLAGTDGTTFTFPSSSDTVVTLAATQTLTNKWAKPRIGTTASSATPSINTDTVDQYNITALAAAITSMTTNLTGTPVDGQQLLIRFLDNGTARAITWGASFTSSGVATLLATTVINKTHMVGLIYDSNKALWVCMAVDANGY
jgi:hypothetical protein